MSAGVRLESVWISAVKAFQTAEISFPWRVFLSLPCVFQHTLRTSKVNNCYSLVPINFVLFTPQTSIRSFITFSQITPRNSHVPLSAGAEKKNATSCKHAKRAADFFLSRNAHGHAAVRLLFLSSKLEKKRQPRAHLRGCLLPLIYCWKSALLFHSFYCLVFKQTSTENYLPARCVASDWCPRYEL